MTPSPWKEALVLGLLPAVGGMVLVAGLLWWVVTGADGVRRALLRLMGGE